tara:strand:- start:479 stop:1099 length:621 start_codon:yes stop_codon:yes gene_type:complete
MLSLEPLLGLLHPMMALTAQDFSVPIFITLAYFQLFDAFTLQQVAAKSAGGGSSMPRFDYSNKRWEMADRTHGNFMEQTPSFLIHLWAYALFISAPGTLVGGLVYLICRLFFPIIWSLKGKWTVWMEMSTQPCYLVMGFWKASLLFKLFTGTQLPLPSSLALRIAALVGVRATLLAFNMLTGIPLVQLTKRGFAEGGKSKAKAKRK